MLSDDILSFEVGGIPRFQKGFVSSNQSIAADRLSGQELLLIPDLMDDWK